MAHILSHLPVDCLSSITSHLKGQDIVKLWLCGDKHLIDRLGRLGGIKEFELEPHPFRRHPLPRLLSESSGLCVIRILDNKYNYLWNTIKDLDWTVLRQVPSILIQHYLLADSFIHREFASNSHYASNLVSLHLAPTLLDDSSPLRGLSRLESLAVRVNQLCLSDLPHATLTFLSLGWRYMDHNKGEKFGDGLETLIISERLFDNPPTSVLVDMLPSHLKTFVETKSFTYSASDLAHLPRSLTDLKVAGKNWAEATLKALPPRLTSLKAGLIHIQYAHLLPPTLTYCESLYGTVNQHTIKQLPLNASYVGSVEIRFDYNILGSLPSTLSVIRLKSPSAFIKEDVSPIAFPTSLHTLYFPLDGVIDCITMLPASLTCLELHQDLDSEIAKKLVNLVELYHFKASSLSFAINIPNLRSLDFERFPSRSSIIVIDENHPFHFPRLNSLRMVSVEVTRKFFGRLAYGLQSLILTLKYIPIGGIQLLPGSIEEMRLTVTDALPGSSDDILRSLPIHLHSLFYDDQQVSGGDLSDVSLEHLPPCLRCLEIVNGQL